MEKEIKTLRGQMEELMRAVENISVMMQQPSESRRPMRACHARRRQSQTQAKKDAPMTGPTPFPDKEAEPEGVVLNQMAASVAPSPAGSHGDTEESSTEFPKLSLFSGSLSRVFSIGPTGSCNSYSRLSGLCGRLYNRRTCKP